MFDVGRSTFGGNAAPSPPPPLLCSPPRSPRQHHPPQFRPRLDPQSILRNLIRYPSHHTAIRLTQNLAKMDFIILRCKTIPPHPMPGYPSIQRLRS
ncbi:hypothetical protein [Geminisphaera colitermitum]|uniref:hypothetical protein n=1 Tax=Geminisphaera colitermitum TaxID=1148786 RepID=UPI00069455F9|nr:hypothetical protein [Geminisphaera colitermitum]